MTTFHEPPLQSRRAARQSERADAPLGQFTGPNAVSQSPEPSDQVAQVSAEPLNYATTSRPPLPQYDGQNLRPRRAAETPEYSDLPPIEALPSQDSPGYRPTDFSPEGRRVAAPTWAPSHDGTVDFQTQNRDQVMTVASAPAAVAEVHAAEGETMTRRQLRALREAEGNTARPEHDFRDVAPSPATPVPDSVVSAPEAAGAPDAPLFAPPAHQLVDLVPPPPLVAPVALASTRLDSALAEFDALASGREPLIPALDGSAPAPGRRAAEVWAPEVHAPEVHAPEVHAPEVQAPEMWSPGVHAPEAQAPEVRAPEVQAPEAQAPEVRVPEAQTPEVWAPEVQAPTALAAQEVPVAAPVIDAPPAVDPLLSAPAPQGAPALVSPPSSSPPAPNELASGPMTVGHWSTQSDIDEAKQLNETPISRSVGAGSGGIATSALMLPSVPEHPIGGPVSGHGEILLTGSISLPHSFSATGAHPSQLDESDLDNQLDPGDHQVANTDSLPVRASRAISTHTASGTIIVPSKPASTRGFTILIVAASVMALVVVGLLVAGFASGTL
ncbi:MAG: hypothetical protein ABJA11_09280 [Pseudolysinimonas sp.]